MNRARIINHARQVINCLISLLLFGCLVPGFQPECRSQALPASSIRTIAAGPEGDLENELLVLTNQQRTQQGIQALVPDESLTQLAREHSRGMAQQGFISHDLPSGDLRVRMSRIAYPYAAARENVASAVSVKIAQSALMDSPEHRHNILADDVDRVGIGIVRCPPPYERELYITEIFAAPPKQSRTTEVYDALLSRVSDLLQNGAGSLVPDPRLEQLASHSVSSLNVPVRQEEIQNLLAQSTAELHRDGRTEIARVDAAVQLVHDPKNLYIPDRMHIGQEPRSFGTAVRQIVDSQNQTAFLVLTLIGFSN